MWVPASGACRTRHPNINPAAARNLTKKGTTTHPMKEDRENPKEQESRYQLAGWILFIVCAIFFIASGIVNRDPLTLIGSVIFLAACLVFLYPWLGRKKKNRHKIETKNDRADG